MKILLVAGARPNFMKIAPIINEFNNDSKGVEWRLVHTGQHYDYDMSKVFFEEFSIPEPDYFLNVGSGSHAKQTSKIMVKFEHVCLKEKPDVVIVVGDVNSTLACSVTSKKLNIKVAHVEAGLRSNDMAMPEEINRIVTDSISDYLFVSEKKGIENLRREGKSEDRIFFVGNIMIDTLYHCLKKLNFKGQSQMSKSYKESDNSIAQDNTEKVNGYAVVTLHRPSNVDDKVKLRGILMALKDISEDMDVVFPMHPRTDKNINKFGLNSLFDDSRIKVMPPKSYLDFLLLWKNASLVLTDSGGIQEETTALGIPCFTIRENTERPITVEEGTNILVGCTGNGIISAYKNYKKGLKKVGKVPELWDGKTAKRIVNILENHNSAHTK